MSYPLTLAAFLLLIAVVSGLFVWVATAGNKKAARRVAAKRLATPPYRPAPRNWVDERGRPY